MSQQVQRPGWREDYGGHLAASAVAFALWFLYASILSIGRHGWAFGPSWWPPWGPSYFQVASFFFPLLLPAVLSRVFRAEPSFAVCVALGGMALFTQNPQTDVVFLPESPLRLLYLCGGSAVAALLARRATRFSVLATTGLVSTPALALLAFTADKGEVFANITFYFWHLALPAQASDLLLSHLRRRRNTPEHGAA